MRAAGTRRSLRDTIVGLNQEHLSKDVETVYEAAEDAGLVAAAVNITCYRGRHRYLPTVPGFAGRRVRAAAVLLLQPLRVGSRSARRSRCATARPARTDEYAAAVGRWLVTRDGFDLLVYYLSDFDFASHAHGPDGAHEALARVDLAVRALVEAAGGLDAFLERYAIILCSDHGQTHVHQAARLEDHVHAPALVTASNRAAMIYTDEPRVAAASLDAVDAVDAAFFLEDGAVVALRAGDEDPALLDEYPARPRARRGGAAKSERRRGARLGRARLGVHRPRGHRTTPAAAATARSSTGDSEVPMLGIGIAPPARTIDIKDALLAQLGVGRAAIV